MTSKSMLRDESDTKKNYNLQLYNTHSKMTSKAMLRDDSDMEENPHRACLRQNKISGGINYCS